MVVLRNSTLVLNSKDRDVSTDPTNNFNLTLARPVFNVVKAELRYFFLQNGIWNLDGTRNQFEVTFTLIASPFTVTTQLVVIPPGYYSQQGFITALQNAFDEVLSGAITSVDINDSNNLVLTSTAYDFTLTFILSTLPSAANALGFTPGTNNPSSTVAGEQILVSPFEVNIAPLPYLYLQSSKLQNNLVTSSGLSAFALVPLTGNLQGVGNADVALGTTYDAGQYSLDASYFTQPITLDRIDIRIVDPTGNPVDTRSNDITIVLRIITSV